MNSPLSIFPSLPINQTQAKPGANLQLSLSFSDPLVKISLRRCHPHFASWWRQPAGCLSGLFLLLFYAGMVCWSVLVWFLIVLFWFCLCCKVGWAKHAGSKLYLQILLLNYYTVDCCRGFIFQFLLFCISSHKITLIPLNKLFWLVGIFFCS